MKKTLILTTITTLFALSAFSATSGTVVNTDGSVNWDNTKTWANETILNLDNSNIVNITFAPVSGNEAFLLVNAPKERTENVTVNIVNSDNVKTFNFIAGSTSDSAKTIFAMDTLKSGQTVNFSGASNYTNKICFNGNIASGVIINLNSGIGYGSSGSTGFSGTLNVNAGTDGIASITRLSGSGNININTGTLNTTAGSSVNSGSCMNLQGDSKLTMLTGTGFTVTSGLQIANGDIDGAITVKGQQSGFSENGNNIHFSIIKTAIFRANATLNTQLSDSTIGRVVVKGSNAKMYTYSASGALKMAQDLQLSAGATLVLNSQNAISNNNNGTRLLISEYSSASMDGKTTANLIIGLDDEDGSKIKVAKNTISNIAFYADSTLTLSLNDNALEILNIEQTGDTSKKFALELSDFIEKGQLVVNNFNNLTSSDVVKEYISADETLGNVAVEFVNGTDSSNGYYIYTTAVPEPAEWAMIFGILALGLVVYRKNK